MQTQLKTDEFYSCEETGVHQDAHIRAYEAQNLGVKVVFCDSRGVPVSDVVAPLATYLPNTSYNMQVEFSGTGDTTEDLFNIP